MEPQSERTEIVRRLRALERSNRRLWIVILVLGLLVALRDRGVVLAGPLGPVVLEADGFVLKDPDGTTRGDWIVDQQGHARLTLYDKAGRPVAELPTATDPAPPRR